MFYTDLIQRTFSGAAAKEDVATVIRHHRIQASPGYRAAAGYVLEELRRAGLEATIERYPANYKTSFWQNSSFEEWEGQSATLHLIEPAEQARKLADFREMKLSLIQRSIPFAGEVEVVLLAEGTKASDYEGLDVAGKLVLTKAEVGRVRQLAVEQFGAVGILFDGMSSAPPVREPMDLLDARQYTSFWWTGREKQCFGFVLTPRQGLWLRDLLQSGQPVKMRAEVKAKFYEGEMEVVTAVIPGHNDESVIIASHLCHPQPSANDNATGVAANLEAARTLQRLIDSGDLAMPRRTIRFLWMPEMTGSYAYLSRHEAEIPQMVAGLNLDMVGADQAQTGSVMLLERPPDAAASFVPDLLEKLREALSHEAKSHTGMSSFPLYRYATTPFSGGSDHYIFSDPTVGVPMAMIIQWPDKFYHTSADTLEKVDPASLARSGSLAAAYAYFVAQAGEVETTWLAYEMSARWQQRLAQLVQTAVTDMHQSSETRAVRQTYQQLQRQVAYNLDRHQEALASLGRLWGGITGIAESLYGSATGYAEWQLEMVQGVQDGRLAQLPLVEIEIEAAESDEWAERASHFVPQRTYRGPGISIGSLAQLSQTERDDWRAFAGQRGSEVWTLPTLAEYWADGRRTALEIADLVEMETGIRDVELVVRYFELLGKMGLVKGVIG